LLLRASGQREGRDYDLNSVTDDRVRGGLDSEVWLRDLTEATMQDRWAELEQLKAAATATLTPQQITDVLTVAAAFNGITRVADATGVPLDPETERATETLREDTGIQRFAYTEKSARFDGVA
tara:strand:+ start:2333 stop:2701 length:369 start_codon:yes stop_codon:yes gene_type:complete